jgi:hypothetical protein
LALLFSAAAPHFGCILNPYEVFALDRSGSDQTLFKMPLFRIEKLEKVPLWIWTMDGI